MSLQTYNQYFQPPERVNLAGSIRQGQQVRQGQQQNALGDMAAEQTAVQGQRQTQAWNVAEQKQLREMYSKGLATIDTSLDDAQFVKQLSMATHDTSSNLVGAFGDRAEEDVSFMVGLNELASTDPAKARKYIEYTKGQLLGPQAGQQHKLGSTRTIQKGEQNVTEEFTQKGWEQIGTGPKFKDAATKDYGPVKEGMKDGKRVFWRMNKKTNLPEAVEGMEPKPPSSQKFTVGPDGTVTFTQGAADDLTRGAKTGLQKDLGASYEALTDLDAISADYNRDYLTYQGKFTAWGLAKKSKANIKLSANEKKFLAGNKIFKQGVNQVFNKYRKWVTGAQAALAELEYLKESMVNTDLSPDEFEPAVQQYKAALQRTIRVKNMLLREGFSLSNKAEWAEAMNSAWSGGEDDEMEVRGDELLKKYGGDEEKVKRTLRAEGYK